MVGDFYDISSLFYTVLDMSTSVRQYKCNINSVEQIWLK